MSLSKQFENCLTLPVNGGAVFLASGRIWFCLHRRAGIVGTFPAKTSALDGLEEWLVTIRAGLGESPLIPGRHHALWGQSDCPPCKPDHPGRAGTLCRPECRWSSPRWVRCRN